MHYAQGQDGHTYLCSLTLQGGTEQRQQRVTCHLHTLSGQCSGQSPARGSQLRPKASAHTPRPSQRLDGPSLLALDTALST